jgi:hypothetical protein
VQALVPATRRPFPVPTRGSTYHVKELFTTYGLFTTEDGFGCLGRASEGAVVNVSQGGGIFPVVTVLE